MPILKEQLQQRLIAILESYGLKDIDHLVVLRKTPPQLHGDVSFNTTRVAKLLGVTPEELATRIAEEFNKGL